MSETEVLEVLQDAGVFRTGHFVFSSGKHSDTYINKDALYPNTNSISRLCAEMAKRFCEFGVEAVIGPAVGAAILSQWTAHHMSEMKDREVFATYADKNEHGGFVLRRGYDKVIAGKRVLLVEDSVTTGASIRKVIDIARDAGAQVVGVIAICNRGSVRGEDVGASHFESLATLEFEQWPQEQCELCKQGVPVNTDLGHGAEFLERRRADLDVY